MLTFAIAYLAVWFGVLAYVLRLGAKTPTAANPEIAAIHRGPVTMIAHTLLLVSLAAAGLLPQANGRIHGTVVNASQAKPSPCQATVLLRVLLEGQFVPFRETTSDAEGRFQFDSLPVGNPYRYLVGANRHGVHYPGPRIQLTERRPDATVELSVCNAVTHPNPLVIRKLEIMICPEPGTLKVTESMLVENPSFTCYVGQSPVPGADPVTLQLAIPADFERTTFEEEFFGRRFFLVEGKLVTGIPWPPGIRALKYTYVLRNAEVDRHWERRLDLPCSQVQLRVCPTKPDEVACDLPSLPALHPGELVFESNAQELPAGRVIHVTLGHLPLLWMAQARWVAVTVLVGLIAGTSGVMIWRRRQEKILHATAPQSTDSLAS